MPPEPLRGVIDNLRSRLQTELEAELARLADSHDEELDRTRRDTEAQAEQVWTARLEALRTDLTTRLQTEVTAARSDADRRIVEEATRARLEAEQMAAESTSALRRDMEEALAAERAKAQSAIDAERAQARAHLDAELARIQSEFDAERARTRAEAEAERQRLERVAADANAALDAERQRLEQLTADTNAAVDAERQQAERALAEAQAALEAERQRSALAVDAAQHATPSLDTTRLVAALRAIDEATSLNGVLRAAVHAAAGEAGRATIFILNGTHLDEWTSPDMPGMAAGSLRIEGPDAGLLADALRRGEPVASGAAAAAPAFASLSSDRHALAVPLMLGGQAVAVLYADEGRDAERAGGWTEAVHILGRHAGAALAAITARKTVEAVRLATGNGQAAASEDEQGARRYARLLVSELKLYNEGAVRVGRQMRDLGTRLRPEIDRARQMYTERVSAALTGRDTYFQQELVQTLADGDPSLLE